tara:strand:+ start:292 stop:621 length:330 start_codon:yes stop_codon:yes gene_type:complete
MYMIIKITEKALPKLRNIMKSYNVPRILFGVKGGGCNGFEYVLEPTKEKPKKMDEIVKKEDVEVVVCSKSLFYIIGTTIDWKNDIMGEKFEFDNPNASNKCGCNTSFSV